MRVLAFSERTMKEVVRDPLNLWFGILFPLVLLFLLTAIQSNIPVSIFELRSLTPGVAVFGLSFLTLFSAMLISKDRESTFLQRLYVSPLNASDFILGYMLPFLPIALVQGLACYLCAFILGLEPGIDALWAILADVPASVFFIALGLLFGSILSSRQVGGICGALLVNLAAWLSGTWFDLSLVGGAFESLAKVLPFYHAVELSRCVLSGTYGEMWIHVAVVVAYAAVAIVSAVLLFLGQMRRR